MKESELELIKRYQTGDNECLSIIYSQNWKKFRNISKRYLCNEEDAEDLVQTVIEKLLLMPIDKRVKHFSNISHLSNMFYSILKNASIDSLRKRRLNCVSIDYANYVEEEDTTYLIDLEYKNVGLSRSESIIFEDYLNKMKPREISAKYGRSTSTIKNTLNNAKRKIINYYRANK